MSTANRTPIAKTDAAGDRGMLPEVLAFTSSLAQDKTLVREDLVGSLAHLAMLARRGIVAVADARAIHGELVKVWRAHAAGTWLPADEEDVHMAVEGEVTAALGEVAGRLHTARSRNDQVALDLRLHVREQAAEILGALAQLIEHLTAMAEGELATLIPSYTHRQRAQPVSLGYVLAGWAAMFARDVDAFAFVLDQADALPLGVGAIAGTSLPTDREVTRGLLRFSRLTLNGLDTVGDRDFALDLSYATARCLLHCSRVATDLVDFATQEFGFIELGGTIACGSSMMPHKRNPDVFELIRGKSGAAVGNLTALLVTIKGLPGGYNRDLQEDRGPLLAAGPLARGVLGMLDLALGHVRFDRARCAAAASAGYAQATEIAEALVARGVAFRTAYQAVGTLVRRCQELGQPLAAATVELAQAIHPAFDAGVLAAAEPAGAVEAKRSVGGTAAAAVTSQIAALREIAGRARTRAAVVPSLEELFHHLADASALGAS
jgi:argininosuccinate lyase